MRTIAAAFAILLAGAAGFQAFAKTSVGAADLAAAPSDAINGVALDAASRAGKPVEARRVWSGVQPDFYAADVSPDGRNVAEIDWTTGDLAVVDVETGQLHRMTGQGYDAGRYAWFSAFSRDGKQLATSWFLYGEASHELRVMNADGTGDRVLMEARPDPPEVDPMDWSPDGSGILVSVRRADRVWQIGLVAVGDGSLRILKTLSWPHLGKVVFSPDGRFIAYDYPAEDENDPRDVFVLATDGSRETRLAAAPSEDQLLGWSPDGSAVLIYSTRSGTPGIWRVQVREGRQAGDAELYRGEVWGLEPVGSTADDYMYGVYVEQPQIHTATVNVKDGSVIAGLRAVDDPPSESSQSADWSPDGRRLAYIAVRDGPGAVYRLIIRTVGGEVSREIPLPSISNARGGNLRWVSEDAVFLAAQGERGRAGIYRIDLRDGSTSPVYQTPARLFPANLRFFEVAPDGRSIFLQRAGRRIVELDIEDGSTRLVVELPEPGMRLGMAVSPDGQSLAYSYRRERESAAPIHEVRVVPRQGGESRVVASFQWEPSDPFLLEAVEWTPDGKHLLVLGNRTDGTVWSIAVNGGEPKKILEVEGYGHQVRVHPDGRRIALTSGKQRGELWLLGYSR